MNHLSIVQGVWNKFKKVMQFYGQKDMLLSLETCFGNHNLNLTTLLSASDNTFQVCTQHMGSLFNTSSERKRREISVFSQIFGQGNELIKIENTLHAAIDSFNKNFKKVSQFDNQVKSSMKILEDDFSQIAREEELLKSHLIELEIRLSATHDRFYYSFLKLQHLMALEAILKQSLISDHLKMLERAIFHQNYCTVEQCETEIYGQLSEGKILIHKKLVSLVPIRKFLITCACFSSFQISTLHNSLAAKTEMGAYLVTSTLIKMTDLKNKSFVDATIRPLLQSEILLGVFHVYGNFKLQCLDRITFLLNGQTITCERLQIFDLPNNFLIVYGNKELRSQKLIGQNQKVARSWLKYFRFHNIPSSLEKTEEQPVSFIHPIIDNVIFDTSGNIAIEAISYFGVGTFMLIFVSCCCCCVKCPGYRSSFLGALTSCFTTLYRCLLLKILGY